MTGKAPKEGNRLAFAAEAKLNLDAFPDVNEYRNDEKFHKLMDGMQKIAAEHSVFLV